MNNFQVFPAESKQNSDAEISDCPMKNSFCSDFDMEPPKCSYPISENRFRTIKESYLLLTDPNMEIADEIHPGDKSNCYVILNANSISKHSDGRLMYYDDCSTSFKKPPGKTFCFNSENASLVYSYKGNLYPTKKYNQSDVITDLDKITKVHTLTYKSSKDPNKFSKKITRFDGINKILVEYLGNLSTLFPNLSK